MICVCGKPVYARGLCSACYQRARAALPCVCGRKVFARGRCRSCYTRGKPPPDLVGSKTCSKCHVERPLKAFYRDLRKHRGVQAACKPCTRVYDASPSRRAAQRTPKYRDKANARAAAIPPMAHSKRVRGLYGLTPDAWDCLILQQSGRCAVCIEPLDAGRNTCVDHDHACCPGVKSCGKCVRGILCRRCNTGLGYADESPARLRAMAAYLERCRIS